MLAMLFEMVSTFSCWASMPVAAMRSALIGMFPYAALPSRWMAERDRSWAEFIMLAMRS